MASTSMHILMSNLFVKGERLFFQVKYTKAFIKFSSVLPSFGVYPSNLYSS